MWCIKQTFGGPLHSEPDINCSLNHMYNLIPLHLITQNANHSQNNSNASAKLLCVERMFAFGERQWRHLSVHWMNFLYNHKNPERHLESNPHPEECLRSMQSVKSGEKREKHSNTERPAPYSTLSSLWRTLWILIWMQIFLKHNLERLISDFGRGLYMQWPTRAGQGLYGSNGSKITH